MASQGVRAVLGTQEPQDDGATARQLGDSLVVSFNPGYQHALKDLKPSTRQRFVALELGLPQPEHEAAIVQHESGVDAGIASLPVTLGTRLRRLRDRGLVEVPSTRLLVATARLIASDISLLDACHSALIAPLSDDPELLLAMQDIVRSLS